MGAIGLLVFIVLLPVSLVRSRKKLATLMITLATFVASVVLFAGAAILNGMAPAPAGAIAWVFGLFCASLALLILLGDRVFLEFQTDYHRQELMA
jgi:hypothetical protein